MTRAAIYARVSTEDQDLEGQIRDLRAHATALGLEVGPAYHEKVSATGKVERKEYDRLRADAKLPGRPWDHLIVWALDRWSRAEKLSEAFREWEELESSGIRLHSFREPYLDTPVDGKPTFERELMRAFAQLSAKWESKRRSERVRLAAREVKEGRRKPRSKWGNRWKVTQEAVDKATSLRNRGKTWAEVAQAVRLPKETVRASVWKAKRGLVTFPSASVIEDWNAGVKTRE